jgi:hypothetical protein
MLSDNVQYRSHTVNAEKCANPPPTRERLRLLRRDRISVIGIRDFLTAG